MPQREVHCGIGEGELRDGLAHVSQFRRHALEELLPRGDVEEQMPHFDACAGRPVPRPQRGERPAVAVQFRAKLGRSCVRDWSVTLPTPPIEASASPRKPMVWMAKRSSAVWSLLVACGAKARGRSSGGMPPPSSTMRMRSVPPASRSTSMRVAAGIDRVLEQFLDDGRRPFDHLARGDLRDDVRRELANPRQAAVHRIHDRDSIRSGNGSSLPSRLLERRNCCRQSDSHEEACEGLREVLKRVPFTMESGISSEYYFPFNLGFARTLELGFFE